MAHKPNNDPARDSQAIPTYLVDSVRADLAYDAFACLRILASERPWLLENPYYTALQDTAYARFLAAFEVE